MWIIPKTHPLYSHFALDMVASKEDLTLQGLNIESSLMWRSKPTQLRTWLQRWKRISWMQHLFTRILKPFHRKSFETKLASSLAVIHVNLFPLHQQTEKEQKILDTSGHISENTLKQYDLFGVSLKMLKDISHLDCDKSSKIWSQWVMQARLEYSQRAKLALRTKEKGSTSWATPRTTDANGGARTLNEKGQRISVSDPTKTYGANLSDQVRYWPTPKGELRTVSGHLNPDWVEWLMGVPTGWTELGC